ncbi:MAG: FtsW/RodA/SpoVE family cell cycle protein, partial [Clostridia bacterium]|nr:FtsW/RodA/SpoVE family cell cycle protein [Clostridia bacterium]
MSGKYTIKRNTIKKLVKHSSSKNEEVKSSSITRKSLSEEFHINIMTTTRLDTSNSSRLLSPIAAEAKKHNMTQRKKRHAVRNLTLKSAPPVPTAPKDPKVRRRQWILSVIKTHLSLIDVPFLALSVILCVIGLLSINSATLSFETPKFVIVQFMGIAMGLFAALVLSVIDYRSFISKYRIMIFLNVALLLLTYIFGSSVTEGTNSNWIDLGIIKIQPSEFAKL